MIIFINILQKKKTVPRLYIRSSNTLVSTRVAGIAPIFQHTVAETTKGKQKDCTELPSGHCAFVK